MPAIDRQEESTSDQGRTSLFAGTMERQAAGQSDGASGALGELMISSIDESSLTANEGHERSLVWWALAIVLASRLFILVVGYLARSNLRILHPHPMIRPAPSDLYRVPIGVLLNGWANMDGGWYLSIAQPWLRPPLQRGFLSAVPHARTSVAGTGVGYVPAGIALSGLSSVAAAVLLFRFTADALGERSPCGPCLSLDRPHELLLSGGLHRVALPSAERRAVLLRAASAVAGGGRDGPARDADTQRRRRSRRSPGVSSTCSRATGRWRRLRAGLVAVLLVPCGLAVYMAYLWRARGDPLLFSKVGEDLAPPLRPPYLDRVAGSQVGRPGPDEARLPRSSRRALDLLRAVPQSRRTHQRDRARSASCR